MPEFNTGNDPRYLPGNLLPLSTSPNGGRLVQGGGFFPNTPPRTEWFLDNDGNRDVTIAWDQFQDYVTISEKHYNPFQLDSGIKRAHSKGITGAGVKIVVLEEYGYSNSVPHESIGQIAGTYNKFTGTVQNSYEHTTNIVGVLCANTQQSKIIGGCYGAEVYVTKWTDLAWEINWAISLGAHIITLSADPYPNEPVPISVSRAIRDFNRSGGVLVVASGNGGSLGRMQKICGLPGVISVGAIRGGAVLETTEIFYSRKIQGFNNKGIDFVVPSLLYGASFSNLDEFGACTETSVSKYKQLSNTSFAVPQVAQFLALTKQYSPKSDMATIFHMIKRRSPSLTIEGITVKVPDVNFL